MTESKSGKSLVIVESPTKAKTIRKFLGKDFIVESCMGHIRDLPESSKDIPAKFKKEKWAQLGVNTEKDYEPIYCVPSKKQKVVDNLKKLLADVHRVYLATDEDREGESISWHLLEVLKPKVPVSRMVFNEITKTAIQKSLKETRDVDQNLVRAQEARRVLDRLVGYTISPLLWKKIAYGLSAGRVQSVAVNLLVSRERERLQFKSSEYWGVKANLLKGDQAFESQLIIVGSRRVAVGKDFDGKTGLLSKEKDVELLNGTKAAEIVASLQKLDFKVKEVEEKPVFRKPAPPFITSTLQQEANRKLGWSARETMQVAQKLYEQGYITYMRTDSTQLSEEAIKAARASIKALYGAEYLPAQVRSYEGKKAKGAQEAHEAIRPAGQEFIHPEQAELDAHQLKLYELIWKRTMACQMVDSRQKQVQVKIQAGEYVLASSGMTIEFPGFLRAYVEGSDDPELELAEREVQLPALVVGEGVKKQKLESTQHETKAPARFTEASLVQLLEKEGVGRPSTYASIIGTIIDRGYVKKSGNALVPTFTAMAVTQLLEKHLPQYVDLSFTSQMEESLDSIAVGELDWVNYLDSVYGGKRGLKHLVDEQEDKIDPEVARTIKLSGLEDVLFKVGRYGAYLSTKRGQEDVSASIPEGEAPGDMSSQLVDELIERKIKGADSIGSDPKSGKPVYVLTGRYGPYVQLGDVGEDPKQVKRTSIPAGMEPSSIGLKEALQLLELPKTLGVDPKTNKEVKVGLGRFGPYVVCDGDFRSIPKGQSLFEVSFEQALQMLSQPKAGGRGRRASALKQLGEHPDIKESIELMNGPYGLYVRCGKVNASLPEGVTDVDLETAVRLLNEKAGSKPSKKTSTREKTGKNSGSPKSSAKAKKELNVVSKVVAKTKESKNSKPKEPPQAVVVRKKKAAR